MVKVKFGGNAMKKFLKVFLVIIVINFAVVGIFSAWVIFNILGPSLKSSGLSYSDILKTEMEPEKKEKLEKALNDRSYEMGNNTAKLITDELRKLLPAEVDYTKMPEIEYPYPSIDEVLENNNKIAQDAANKGMDMAKKADEENQKIRDKSLGGSGR